MRGHGGWIVAREICRVCSHECVGVIPVAADRESLECARCGGRTSEVVEIMDKPIELPNRHDAAYSGHRWLVSQQDGKTYLALELLLTVDPDRPEEPHTILLPREDASRMADEINESEWDLDEGEDAPEPWEG